MTSRQRAKKINELLHSAVEIQAEAKRMNGHDCFNMKSIYILQKLAKQIELGFEQLSSESSKLEQQQK